MVFAETTSSSKAWLLGRVYRYIDKQDAAINTINVQPYSHTTSALSRSEVRTLGQCKMIELHHRNPCSLTSLIYEINIQDKQPQSYICMQ